MQIVAFERFYRHFWSEASMIVGTGFENNTTNPPVVLEEYGVGSMESIDMYIDHDSRVGVCLSSKRSRIALAMIVYEASCSTFSRKVAGRSLSSGLCRYA